MARGPFKYRAVNSKGGVILFRGPVRRKVAAKASDLAKKVPEKPPHFSQTATKAMRASTRINLADRWAMQAVGDAASLRKRVMAGKAVKREPKLAGFLDRFEPGDWGEMLLKLKNRYGEVLKRRVNAVKGLFFELAVRQLPEFEQLLTRCTVKLQKVHGWDGPHVVRRARTKAGVATGEVGDYLVLAFDNPKKPTKVWVMAVVESKSEYNAIQLIHKGEFSGIPEAGLEGSVGEMLGQGESAVERVKVFGLDLDSTVKAGGLEVDGYGKFEGDSVRIRHEGGLTPDQQTTELLGVIPSDTPTRDLNTIENHATARGLQIWKHGVTGKDAAALAEDAINAYDATTTQ